MDAFYRGEVRVGLKYLPSESSKTKGSLVIDVKQARELPAMDGNSTDAAVKLHLLPNRKSSGKRKTEVIKKTLNPVWEETFTYDDVTLEELSRERVLEVSIWNYDKSGNTFVGGLRLGPAPTSVAKHKDWMDSTRDEVIHWEDMLAHPGEWVEHWHTLRTTLNPRNVDVQASLPPVSHTPPHALPTSLQEKSPVFSPMLLADEFQKTGSSKVSSTEEKKDTDVGVQSLVVGSIDLAHTSSHTSHTASPLEHESTTPSSVLWTDEFKKTAPPKVSNIGEKKEKESPIHASRESTTAAKTDSPPLQPKTSSGATKSVFSSSVRNRPTIPHAHTTTQTQEVSKDFPKDVSGNTHVLQILSSPHALGHQTDEEETPVITVEEDRTPPRATSTPLSKGTLDLSEVGVFAESPGNVGSYQVRYSVHLCIVCVVCVSTSRMNNKYSFETVW